MDRYKETFETWNKIAKLYEDKFMNLNIYDETYDFFCSFLNIIKKYLKLAADRETLPNICYKKDLT
ncbi:hypothetical protein [Flavobacterium chungangense]|uniref:hypothetical protein n=1 Tax=Flavobacterium chungangense TaxID=554283 RepID=UPI000B258F93|nr:hypothetical protein [Flavobacterium chungangense]